MTRDDAIQAAMGELGEVGQQRFIFSHAIFGARNNRSYWMIVFKLKEEKGVVEVPDTFSVEVDDETGETTAELNP